MMPGSVNCSFNTQASWQQQPVLPASPQPNTIYVWQANVNQLLHHYQSCLALLNDAERTKAFRYYHTEDQQRYILHHGLLRLLLGWYIQQPATDIRFNYNATRKPYLVNSDKTCFFNISHSGPELLIAIGDKEIGVDIERTNYDFHYADIASQYFSATEVAFINNFKTPTDAFFLLWTRKEALLKACGTGIDDNLPAMPALDGLHQLPPDYNNTAWLTHSLNATNNCIISLTYPKPDMEIIWGLIAPDLAQHLFSPAL